jgi:serine/threonine-protein kinase
MSSDAAVDTSGDNEPLLHEGEIVGGRYRIERYLGGGGMAAVYKATHEGLDQPVALKVVSRAVRELPGCSARFIREARAATKLKGEHIVRVFDVGTTDQGTPYFAMELLEGKDLNELLESGTKPSVEEAIDYILQAAEALAEVHGLGIVHRDLKPANLFVTRGADGRPCLKLIDFGISRIDQPLSPKDALSLTSPDVVMGSPRYMPPEQMESAAAADTRSDIWGLGAILYELLCGDAPFDGESLMAIYASVVRSPPPLPSSINPAVPAELDAVILKCLSVDPAGRFADVAELANALAPIGDERAPMRAEAIARVLEASRARGQGASEPVEVSVNRNSSSSHIRRKLSQSRVNAMGRKVAVGMVALGLVGLGFGAQPLADRFTRAQIGAPATITGAALVSEPTAVAPAPPLNTEPFGPPPPPVMTKSPLPVPAPPAWKPALPLKGPSADALFEERK